jgi:hypothetical protein
MSNAAARRKRQCAALVMRDGRASVRCVDFCQPNHPHRRSKMTLTVAHLTPLVALIAGILILIIPRLLNFIVAVYLIVTGLIGLNAIYHFVS